MTETEYRAICKALRRFENDYREAVTLTGQGGSTDAETRALRELLTESAPALDRAISVHDTSEETLASAVRSVTEKREVELNVPLKRIDWYPVDVVAYRVRRLVTDHAQTYMAAYQEDFLALG